MTLGYSRTLAALAVSLAVLIAPASAGSKADLDQDGLKDSLEQDLLERFRPQFMIASGDCVTAPSEFAHGASVPTPIAANGTIYGQVFRVPATPMGSGDYVEIHYFHLWARDCGPFGHPLDVEHVSVLVRADKIKSPARKFTAAYWYAAAHENTMCDAGHGVRAAAMGADDAGIRVWISRGKHGSFLATERCGRGCGADVCDPVRVLKPGKLINIGELGHPMNGALWVASKRWRLADKLESDFTPVVLAELNNPNAQGVISLSAGRRAVQAVVAVTHNTREAIAGAGGRTNNAVSGAAGKTDGALTRASDNTSQSVEKSARLVGQSLKKAHARVRGWFEGLRTADAPTSTAPTKGSN